MGKRSLVMLICIAVIIGAVVFRITQSKKEKEKNNELNKSCFVVSGSKITGYYYNLCGKDAIIPSEYKGKKIKTIGESAFARMQLTSVVIPSGITTIEENAFSNNEIKELIIPESVETIDDNAFANNKITKLTIKSKKIDYGESVFNNNQLPDNQAFVYSMTNGENKNIIVSYAGSKRDKVVIPGNVTDISNSAFADCGIKNIVLNNNLVYIGNNAFAGNDIESVSIPSNVDFFGDNAFDFKIKTMTVSNKDGFQDFGYFGMQSFDTKMVKFTGKKNKKSNDEEHEEEKEG